VAAVAIAIALVPAIASAQIADGRRLLAGADFEGAIQAFDRAEQGTGLDREGAIRLFEGRAMARWATCDEGGAQRDLGALAALDPDHRFPPEAPPELAAAFRRASRANGGEVEIEVEWEDGSGRTTLRSRVVHGGEGALVRTIRTHVRVAGGPWRAENSGDVDVIVPAAERVEAWVEAIGPGGLVVARAGSERQPLVHGGEAAAITGMAMESDSFETVRTEERPRDDSAIWIGVGVGIALAAGAAVAIVLGFVFGTATSDRTQPQAPIVQF
jgi:hypothetical protein